MKIFVLDEETTKMKLIFVYVLPTYAFAKPIPNFASTVPYQQYLILIEVRLCSNLCTFSTCEFCKGHKIRLSNV